jgi:signal transduction histidine kinase
MNSIDIAVMVVVVSMTLLVLASALFIIMIGSANRRHRHRAELAELHLHRDQELRQVEREAMGHTMSEIGRELHDNVGQLLTVAQLGLRSNLDAATQQHMHIHTAMEALDLGMDEVRRLGRSLNQDHWQRRELIEALELEAVRLERLGKARVLLEINARPADPPADVKTILFRAFQEVISNALRHSGARSITITVDDQAGLALRISDNGRGCDPATVVQGSGLDNIRHRCRLINYTATMVSAPGEGCAWHFNPDPAHAAQSSPGG